MKYGNNANKVLLFPGAFNPLHFHHLYGMDYVGRKHEMDSGVLILSYNHPEKNNLLDIEKRSEIAETYLEEMPLSFPVEISLDEKITRSTGRSIINECERREGEKYLLLGLDALLEKLDQMEDYEKILELNTLIVNDYDRKIKVVREDLGGTTIEDKSECIFLPVRREKIIVERNPFSGLHSTDIRENPEKYLYIFPEKTKELIRKYYIRDYSPEGRKAKK